MPTLVRYLQRIDAGRPLIDLDLALEHCIQFWPFDDEGNCLQRPHDFLDPCRDRYYYEFPDGLWLSVSNPTMPRDQWQYSQINPIWVLQYYLPNRKPKPITKMPDSLRKYSAYLDRHVFAQWQADQADDPWIGLDSSPPKTTMDYEDPRTADEAAPEARPEELTPPARAIADSRNEALVPTVVPIVLGGPDDDPTVLGKRKKRLTPGQYRVVKTLLDSQPERLSKDQLAIRSETEDPVKMIDRLRRDEDWKEVLDKPGQAHGGYGIRVTTPRNT